MAHETPCPACGRPTDSLKTYPLVHLANLFFAFSVRREVVTACPQCMRRRLLQWGTAELLAANVFWPFFIFPILGFRLITSFRRGATASTAAVGWVTVLTLLTGLFLSAFTLAVAIKPRAGVAMVAAPAALYVLLLGVALARNW